MHRYVLFSLFWLIMVYLYNCALAKSWKRIQISTAVVYFLVTATIGLYGEIFLNTAYNTVVGHPLWYYLIAPIRDGYTSSFAIVTWGLFGLHLYLMHDTLRSRLNITKARHLALVVSIEALVLEALLTLSAKPVFGTYMYYYLPSDLFHVTSLQNIPFYFIFGVVAVKTLHRAHKDKVFYGTASSFLLIVILMLNTA